MNDTALKEYLQHAWPDTYKRHTQFSMQLNEFLDRQTDLLAVVGAADHAMRARCNEIVSMLYAISSLLHELRRKAEIPEERVYSAANAFNVTVDSLQAAAYGIRDQAMELTRLVYDLKALLDNSEELLSPRILSAADDHLRMLYEHGRAADELAGSLHQQACMYQEAEAFQFEKKRRAEARAEQPVMDALQVSALSPKQVVPGDYGLLDVVLYEKDCREAVERILQEHQYAQEHPGGVHKADRGTEIDVVLSSPDVQIDEPRQTQRWQGEYLRFSFDYFVPEEHPRQSILLRAVVYISGVPATRLSIRIDCGAPAGELSAIQRADVKSAFMSYSVTDRHDVLRIVQGIQMVRPDMRVFVDVDSLRDRERWQERIFQEIDRSDVLYLCWSEAASQSDHVDQEWRYALAKRGADFIEPLALTPAEVCPPPAELQHLQFGSRLLYIIHFKKSPDR